MSWAVFLRTGSCSSIGDPGGPDDPVLHREELVEILEGQSHQLEEDRAGHRHGQLGVQVAASFAGELVDDAVEELDHLLFECRHRTRCEERVEDPPVLHVLRGVDLKRDERPNVAELDRLRARREHGWRPQSRLDVLAASDDGELLTDPHHRLLAHHPRDSARVL